MKEQIYTIPVTEAFQQECECPVCVLEKKLEDEYVDYYLGAALMEPDCRIETNRKGFCRRHFELLYNRQENRLGLGLETDTHLREKLEKLRKISTSADAAADGAKAPNPLAGLLSGVLPAKSRQNSEPLSSLLELLKEMEDSCTICDRLEYTMERYMDVTMYLWSEEEDFRKLFENKSGFCMMHLKRLAEASAKYLKPHESALFLSRMLRQQIEHLDRIEKELDWFTKKFDYRNQDAPWGNSKDALPRSIQKLKGYSSLK